MTVDFFKEILTEPALKDFEFLRLDEGEIDAECLDLVMETAHSNRDLFISGTKVPKDYYHENAFKFYDIFYGSAEWVRLEQLFTLTDRFSVYLGVHSLTSSDVNNYIKFWIDNDHDMVLYLRIAMRSFKPELLFDGIVVLEARRRPVYFFAANPKKQKKHQIMSVIWFNEQVILSSDAVSLIDSDSGQPIVIECRKPEYKVLMILNKKKELEEELEEIQNLLETNQDQNMIEKKDEISKELQSVSADLDNYNLVFRNGTYIYTETQK
ncbi:hypothetical protein CAEBREN_21528 [Caenorhabditis brenneri]|uniref:Uncharacterized protein n=1 Tax=Caenorhabditis brenneri TaxID=135651 RepID=G0P7S6_CAEBE|nr:hypothetical protein CAEBREN_21528 [Caenorhabditis brenneri]